MSLGLVPGYGGPACLLVALGDHNLFFFFAEELILSVCGSLNVYGFPAYLEKADKMPHRPGTVDFGARAVLGRIAGWGALLSSRAGSVCRV